MARHLVILVVCFLFVLASPASASLVYSNGAPSTATAPAGLGGNGFSYLISALPTASYWVADTFTLAASTTLSSVGVAIWFPNGVAPTAVSYSIWNLADCTAPDHQVSPSCMNSPIESGSPVALTNASFVFANGAYTLDVFSFALQGLSYADGSYWLRLENVLLPGAGRAYWDENSGSSCTGDGAVPSGCPSGAIWSALEDPLATQGDTNDNHSESFQMYGVDPVPEPGSITLIGLGLLALAGILRRRRC
jgi:hypothetical protein